MSNETRDLGVDWDEGHPSALSFLGVRPGLADLANPHLSRYPREELVAIIRAIHANTGVDDPSVEDSLSLLSQGAGVIVTGQQPGLMGGPLLVSLKIATAIRLARSLTASGQPTVPVFWNASEDHDLDEANRLYLRASDRTSTELHHLDLPATGAPLDQIRLNEGHREALRVLYDQSGERLEDEEDLPHAGEDLGRWMTRTQARRFQGTGLLLVEPRDLNPLARDIKRRLVANEDELCAAWRTRRQELITAGYTPQFGELDDSASLFMFRDGGVRRRLTREGTELRSGETVLDLDEISVVDDLSPSALLRPLVQQAVLPVIAQVSGPAEIRYFAECRPLFAITDQVPPHQWRRARGYLIHRADAALLAEREITFPPVDADAARTRLRHEADTDDDWSDYAAKVRREAGAWLESNTPANRDDAQLIGFHEQLTKQVDRSLRDLESRVEKARRRRDRDARLRLERLRETLFPRERPQERVRSHANYHRLGDHPRGTTLVDMIDPEVSDARFLLWENPS